MSNILKTISRFWLVIVNLFFLAVAGLVIFVGVVLFQSGSQSYLQDNLNHENIEKLTGKDFVTDYQAISIALMAVGGYMALTAFLGCCGSIVRINGLLYGYIVTLTIAFLAVMGIGGYTIDQSLKQKENWSGIKQGEWAMLPGEWKEFFQVLYQCCGYHTADNLAYTDDSILFANSTTYTNFCTTNDPDAYEGCHDRGIYFWNNQVKMIAVLMGVVALFVLITIPATIRAKKRALSAKIVKGGFQPIDDKAAGNLDQASDGNGYHRF